jgi:hypothetical protein
MVKSRTSDSGIDGQTPVDVDELDLIPIDPLRAIQNGQNRAEEPRLSPACLTR